MADTLNLSATGGNGAPETWRTLAHPCRKDWAGLTLWLQKPSLAQKGVGGAEVLLEQFVALAPLVLWPELSYASRFYHHTSEYYDYMVLYPRYPGG